MKKRFLRMSVNIILCAILFLNMGSVDLNSAQKISKEVYMSEWNAHLADHKDLVTLYYGLKDAVDEEGEPLYSDEFIIGFLANVESEANAAVVEYAFSREHAYGFALPSGSTKIRSIDDIYYLMNWPISDEDTEEGLAAKGSCGVSSVQWSYGRRIKYLERLRKNLGYRYDVTSYDIYTTDLEMVLYELEPEKRYYNEVMEAMGDKTDVANYAEAFCDRYFKPKRADLNMSGTGEACKERRKLAEELWELYTSGEMVLKTIEFTF